MPPETLDSLDKDSLKPLVLQLLARIDALLAQNNTLLARIAELEARCGQPPKTPDELVAAAVERPEGQSSRAAAREEGPQGSARRRAHTRRTSRRDARHLRRQMCSCGAALSVADQPHVFAYDHIDLPPIKPITTRINLHRGQCPCCKKRVAATPPADMAPGSPYGRGIVAVVTYLHACQMISYARMTEMLDGLFGLKISEGAIANMLARAETPFAAHAVEIAQVVRNSPVIASDETSARVCGKTHWQWTFLAASAVYHTIAPTRGKAVPAAFLGGKPSRRCGCRIGLLLRENTRRRISIASRT